jgi:WD40 repeat protein
LCYVKRKRALFSAGTDGAIFAWNIDKIFSNEFLEVEAAREKEKQKFDYTLYIAEKTPWFIGSIIHCLIDLPNLNFLATGSDEKLIRLWDLRGGAIHEQNINLHGNEDNKTSAKNTKTSGFNRDRERRGTVTSKKSAQISKPRNSKLGDREDLYDDYAKEPAKILEGHTKAVREIAYSEKHKILVSCGFDF